MQFRPTPSPQSPDPDAASAGGGEAIDTTTADTGEAAAGTVDGGAATADAGLAKPASMHDAMFPKAPEAGTGAPTAEESAEAAKTGKTVQQLRDERGRFAGKAPAADGQQAQQGQQQPKPKQEGQEDLTQMPEGLTPKAQQRFQALANSNKELTAQLSHITQSAGSIERAQSMIESSLALQATFQQHGVKREQFDQAMQVVGLMNRGDLKGALAALDEQRELISLALGQSVPGVDVLAKFPDLQAKVDNMLMTQEDAEELARARMRSQQAQQHQQRQNQHAQQQAGEQQAQQQFQQAVRDGQIAVDKFCLERQKNDLDYAHIEPLLLKEIEGGLLQGVPPAHWPRIVQKTYELIKQTASQTRASSGAASTVLRPTGGEAPIARPQNAFEAMWKTPRPAGA